MSNVQTFATATQSGLYDLSCIKTPEDQACMTWLVQLAESLPMLETAAFPLETVVELKEAIPSLPQPSTEDEAFAAAFTAFTATIDKRFGRDGNGNPIAVGSAHEGLLNALNVFHASQDKVPLSGKGLDHFAEIFRVRQVYRDMAHGGLGATTYDVQYT